MQRNTIRTTKTIQQQEIVSRIIQQQEIMSRIILLAILPETANATILKTGFPRMVLLKEIPPEIVKDNLE